jgi:hypothetical protein
MIPKPRPRPSPSRHCENGVTYVCQSLARLLPHVFTPILALGRARRHAHLCPTRIHAHVIVGNRLFPATLATDDPGVADELALPTVSSAKTGDVPSVKELDISAEYAKRITEDFGVSFAPTWTRLYAPGGPALNGASGFQNIETTFKYQAYTNVPHEFVLSVGLSIEWGGSGAQEVGAERFTVFTPTVYFGKCFGDLPDSLSWARPSPASSVTPSRASRRPAPPRPTRTRASKPSIPNSTRASSPGVASFSTACPA